MKKKIILSLSVLLLLTTILPSSVFAIANLGEIFQGLGTQAGIIGKALVIIAATSGIGMLIAGGFQLYKASKGRGEATYGKASVYILAGVVLVSLVAVAGSGSKTVFGDEDAISEHVTSFE